jgi:hypothetical protein
MTGAVEANAPKRGAMRFRRSKAPRLAADRARRQGEIADAAFQLHGREKAIDFLNPEDASLGARPLDLAIASAEGRDRVEAALGRMVFAQSKEIST